MFIRFILLLLLTFSFSCNSTDTKKHKIGFSQCISKDDWRKAMDHEMEVEASLYEDIDLTIFQGNEDVELQKSQIEFMIDNEFDVIIVSPLRPEPLVSVIEKAYDKGIPVIIVDRKINSQKFTAFIGANNLDVGRNAANYIASLNEKPSRILEIRGSDNSSPVIERHLGFHEIIYNEPNITVEYRINDEDIEQRVPQILDSLHVKPINFVYAFNDDIAYRTWKIAKSKGVEESIKFIGVDGLNGANNGIQLVQNGILAATILYPTGGDEAIKIAMKILRKENVSKNNILNTTVIDYRNAEIMKNQYDKINKHQNEIEEQQEKITQQEETYSTQKNILKVLLGLLITSLLLAIYSVYSANSIKKKKRELEIQNKKITTQRNQIKKFAEEVKVSNDAKTNFFTGLSHEFKTPITLILSSIESLSEDNAIKDNKLLREVGLIYNNSKRLLRLINQLLDFRKIEDRKFILKASETNIYEFSTGIFKDFEREAQKRNIEFLINTNDENLKIYIDRNLMDKVYFNLLSNAFKFTPNNGSVHINIINEVDSNFVKINFKDSGIGIPKKDLDNVFQAFFQASNNNKVSSGIGLHLSKEFVEMHKGTIDVSSKHGTEFTLTLYKGNAHLSSDEIIYEPDLIDNSVLNFNADFEENEFVEVGVVRDEEHYSILIIEDNSDLIKYLRNKLIGEYDVHVSDGTDGIEKAYEIVPDIIICDINLPDKTGFEICEILKKDLRTSHIPTIMLTALNNKESYLKGLESGADLYLTKPFSFAVLQQSIKTMIYNREKLRYYFINNIHKINTDNSFGSIEQDFLSKINEIINENLDNSKFSVENLATALNISRVQLYRKTKAILGVSISDYIQNIRLEKAKTLLKETKLTISEIAYATGFSSPNYFSTSFKNKFDNSPKAYRAS
ncbi:substrate-binding domain-containing protein [Algibacter amylolyticus]|uniref:histidine kinase n=2 Tax=Algibacter amylolyticus TaxID=1608400 RepID=A0A5M7BFN5_9FLAO|nr:substrate-binding domain-containing protein [Algibacter amylolyticus]KAA5827773.1 substrate-binding domain-containing protein [Algibacter amylolyticus]TSJ82018.1 substrate-binding domain-containing protein [Algibacter amylolyticus]